VGDAVTLIVLVAAGAAGDPTTVAMKGATRDALGGALVEVREARGAAPDDDAALATETSAHADAVVELGWTDPRHRQATLRVHIASAGRWIERVIAFRPSDAPTEKGRTLGFAVASMLPDAAADHAATGGTPIGAGSATPPSSSPAASATPAPSAAIESSSAPATPAPAPTPPVVTPATAAAPPSPPPPARAAEDTHSSSMPGNPGPTAHGNHEVAIDLLALGSIGISGSSESAGGGAAGNWFLFRALALRLAAGVRAGAVGSARGVGTLAFLGAAGVAWHPWRSTSSQPLGLSIRVDYLLEGLSATGFAERDFRWVSGVDAVVEAGLRLTTDVDVLVGFGVDGVFAITHVDLLGSRVATLPTLSALAETGLRLRF